MLSSRCPVTTLGPPRLIPSALRSASSLISLAIFWSSKAASSSAFGSGRPRFGDEFKQKQSSANTIKRMTETPTSKLLVGHSHFIFALRPYGKAGAIVSLSSLPQQFQSSLDGYGSEKPSRSSFSAVLSRIDPSLLKISTSVVPFE